MINISNILYIKPNLKFVKSVVKKEIINPLTNEFVIRQQVVIKIKNINNGKSRIHPYTAFLNQYINRKTKYVINIAGYLVSFLNYIYFDISILELESIEHLTFDVGINYLNSLNCSRSVKEQCDRVLTNFYYYLCDRNIIKMISKNKFQFVSYNNKIVLKSPFDGKYYKPQKAINKKLHYLEKEYIFPFLEISLKIEPVISFGIYLQMFGGLRVSEVISLEYSNISFTGSKGVKSITLTLEDKDLRPDIVSGFISKVKVNRKQKIIPVGNGLLYELYKNHKNYYKNSNFSAIFINNKNKPMTEATYRHKFNKVKTAFINELLQSSDINNKTYGLFLNTQEWSTHIGRGVFSNLVADVAISANEIALWRGDSNLDSSLKYITDAKKIEDKLLIVMSQFYSKLGDGCE